MSLEVNSALMKISNEESQKSVALLDIPGALKLSAIYLPKLIKQYITPKETGLVVFVLDSSSIFKNASAVAKQFHDLLQLLVHRQSNEIHILVACNKSDSFTTMPAKSIQDKLTTELASLATDSSAQLRTVAASDDDEASNELLGFTSTDKFTFEKLEQYKGIAVTFLSGSALKGKTEDWGEWIRLNV